MCNLDLPDAYAVDASSGNRCGNVRSLDLVVGVVVGIGEVEEPALLGYIINGGGNAFETACCHNDVHAQRLAVCVNAVERTQVVGSGIVHEFVAQGTVAIYEDNEVTVTARIGAAAIQFVHEVPQEPCLPFFRAFAGAYIGAHMRQVFQGC